MKHGLTSSNCKWFYIYSYFIMRDCLLIFKVKLTDMQVRGAPRTLLPGEPSCAPSLAVMTEALVSFIRSLHRHAPWKSVINKHILDSLSNLSSLVKLIMDCASAENGLYIGPMDGLEEERDTSQHKEERPSPTTSGEMILKIGSFHFY